MPVSMVKLQMKFQIICIKIHYSLFMKVLSWLPIAGLCIIDKVTINLKNKQIFLLDKIWKSLVNTLDERSQKQPPEVFYENMCS